MVRRTQKRKSSDMATDALLSKEIPSETIAATIYNPRTGRPIRRSAGRKSLEKSFVDPDDAMSEEDEDVYLDDFDDNVRVAKRRKRSPTPPMTPSRLIDDTEPLDESIRPHEHALSMDVSQPISLTFNLPPGHTGPFVVNLDVNSLVKASQMRVSDSALRSQPRSSPDSGYASKSREVSEQNRAGELSIHSSPRNLDKAGFLSLPPELRNEIYRLVFVKKEKLDFGHPHNFTRSSHLLRTCKQIHEEGKSILYAENVFYFQSSRETRTRRFEPGAYQIGYKDIRYFLSVIGPANLGLIRHVIFVFEDLVPSLNPRLKSIDERRFTSNEDLYAALRLLGDHGRLQTLKLSFQGRRWFFEHDEIRFSSYLVRIKADNVAFISWPDHFYNAESKSPKHTENDLAKEMSRPIPMYSKLPATAFLSS
ncbi:hypothetical protein BDV97DRAFT_394464 [Delphinella strobiligena]|nr:hypothetical protein BDV97DRAFT_394464 [Delphinella strobiligena]